MRALVLLIAVSALAAGCVSVPSSELDSSAATGEDMAALAPSTEKVDGVLMLSAATPVRTFSNGGVAHFFTPDAEVTGLIVEVEWTPSSAASNELSVWVRPAGAGAIDNPNTYTSMTPPVARVNGPSPIRVELPADLLESGLEYEVLVRAAASPVGVAGEQEFVSYLTTFKGLPFDAAFSALGAE